MHPSSGAMFKVEDALSERTIANLHTTPTNTLESLTQQPNTQDETLS
jgi:hypothetical protein